MMVITPRIAAVSYLNTVPFIYGIRHEGNLRADILLSPPATCAERFRAGEVDIALLPAAVVPSLAGANIVTDYCIGAKDNVRTVVLMSNTPIKDVRRIYLDPHSLTSVQLTGYLAKNVWKIAPEWYAIDNYDAVRNAAEGDAYLLIGDKVFDYEGATRYGYDLAAEWHGATSLPFAFAVWVARKGTSFEITDALETSLTFGVERIYEAVLESDYASKSIEAYEYLTRNIDFVFDIGKRQALQKFWDAGIKVAPHANPG